MGFDNKLDTLNERKRDVERELAGLAEAKQQSDNTALSELENALLGELDQIQNKITQLHTLIDSSRALNHIAS